MFMMSKSSRVNLFCKKCVLKNLAKFIQTRSFWRIFKKEAPTRGFSCKFCQIDGALMALFCAVTDTALKFQTALHCPPNLL